MPTRPTPSISTTSATASSGDQVHRRLRGAAAVRRRRVAVDRVLRDVDVERGEVDRAELQRAVVDRVELVFVVRAAAALERLRGARQGPLVDVEELLGRQRVGGGIEVVQIRQEVPRRVAQLAITLADA